MQPQEGVSAEAIVRDAMAGDEQAILSLARDFATSFQVDAARFHEGFHALLAEASASVLVAQHGDQVIGYLLGFDHVTFFANGRVGWVEEIMVRTEFRRRGVGKLLMEHFEERARSRGAKLVALATRRAGDFYQALGYEDSASYFRKLL
jgi:GNAT superfamily N-acetyltransferase